MAQNGYQRKRSQSKDKVDGQKRAKDINGSRFPSNQRQLTIAPQEVVENDQPRDQYVDSDATQPPSPNSQFGSDESNHTFSNDNSANIPKKRKGRGRSKCMYVDMHTSDGNKIKIRIPEQIGRAIGKNARKIVNFCGMVVRNEAKLSYKSWPVVKKEVGDIMLAKVKDKFEMDVDDDHLFSSFVFSTMRRLYRCWKSRHQRHWSKLNETEKGSYTPKDVDEEDWDAITNYWMSDEFKKISQRNKDNRAKNTTKHTCGSVAFVEIEENTKNAITGEKLTADELWLVQHTKKNDKGEQVWSDPTSEENYHKLKDLVSQQKNGDIPTMTDDEMLVQVLGKTSGYFRGRGAGVKAPSSKGTNKTIDVNQIREEIQGQMQQDFEKIVEEKMAIERAKLDEEREKMVREQEKRENELRANMKKEVLDWFRAQFPQPLFQPESLESFHTEQLN